MHDNGKTFKEGDGLLTSTRLAWPRCDTFKFTQIARITQILRLKKEIDGN